jgi:hypothetical protein
MGVSRGDTCLLKRHNCSIAKGRRPGKQESIMKTSVKLIAPWLAAAAIGGAIALAPVAAAATVAPAPGPAHAAFDTGPDPLVPYGPTPRVPFRLGYINPNHDEGDFTNGQLDVPF